MAKKKQFVTAAAAFAVAASAVAPAITADAATSTVRLSSDYVRVGDLDATLDKEYKGSEIYWYKSSVDMNKLGVFQTAKGFVKGQGIRVEKRVRVLNYAQEIKPESEFVFEQGVPVSGIRVQPVLFADGNEYAKPVSVAGFNTDKVGEFEGTLTYANRAYGVVTKTVKYKVVASNPEVKEVMAVNSKQVKLTGVALDKLKADQFTLEGNKVLSYVVSEDMKEATLTFEKALPSGKEQSITLTEKVEGEADKVSELKVTYTLKVESVKAMTTRIDETQDKQMLKFAINDESTSADLEYLKEAGYTISFQSTKPSVFVDAATGEIDEAAISAGDSFVYKVVITKDDVSVESGLVEVKVVDNGSVTTEITDYDLVVKNDVVVTSKKIALNDTGVSLTNIEGTLLDGTKEANISGDAKFKSSNPAVAVIGANGAITPVAPGNVTFTIESGDAKVEVPVTIVAEGRTATKVTTSVSSTKLVNSATQSVSLTVLDQYGDAVKGFDLDAWSIENSNSEAIAGISNADATDAEGKTSFVVTADAANVGTGSIQIKNGNKVLSTISLTVAAAGDVNSRKIELSDASKDAKLDIVKGSNDTTVDFVWNKYNASGFLIGPENDYDTDGAGADTGKYTVVSSDEDVATVTVNDSTGVLTVTGGTETGTAKIKIMEGTITRATVDVMVTDSTPMITSVTFENVQPVKTAKFLTLTSEVLKPENVKINAAKTVSIDPNGVIYIDVNGGGYSSTDDITLGSVEAISNVRNNGTQVPVAIASGQLGTTAGAAFSAGDEGSVVVKVTRAGEASPVAVSTITVDIPE